MTNGDDINQQSLTEEQMQTINNFNKKIFKIRKELREVQRELGEDIKQLEAFLKLINIWLMPILVIIIFLIFKYFTIKKIKIFNKI